MSKVQSYFEKLLTLQNLEKEEEVRQFRDLMQNTTVSQRVNSGRAWHPLKVIETGYGFGQYPFAIVERTRAPGMPHHFGSGKTVGLFSTDDSAPDGVKGAIQFVNGDQMKLIFLMDEMPDLLDYGKLGIDLLFDENAYKETESALKLVSNAKNCRLNEIRDALIGIKEPELDETVDIPGISGDLNPSQKAAVELIFKSLDFCVVHGPPGTGKTTTLIEAARLLCADGERVMMAAPSNAAADWLTHKAKNAGLNVVRIGNPARIDEELESLTVEGYLQNHKDYSEIKGMRKRAAELRRMATKYKRQFGHSEREQRKLILNEARLAAAEARKLEDYIIESTIQNADVITCTLVGANHSLLGKMNFDTVFIDEAAQAPEPACWIPIIRANRVVLAGDPFQLPPTIKSREAASGGLSVTLLEKVISSGPVALLTLQYRMNSAIMAFSNQWFYKGALEAFPGVANWQIGQEQVLEFIDTAGLGWEEQANPETSSLYNTEEAELLWKRLEFLALQIGKDDEITVGVISPYREQVVLMESQWKHRKADFPNNLKVEVQTIDSFQGQERDAIYVSLVRSNNEQEIGFLKDYRRMNVAMTRARKKLVLIGDSGTLGADNFYRELIDHAEKNESYRSAWEFQ